MDHHLSYRLIRSRKRRKTVSLQIKEDGKIVIHVPYKTPQREIERFVEEKKFWIFKRISEKEKSWKESGKRFLPGEEFLYLGVRYPLELKELDHKEFPLNLSFGTFVLDKNRAENARELFTQWYKKEAKEIILDRVDSFGNRLGLFPEGVKVTSARYRWGSCSPDNRLSFSWRIIMASLSVIDYILIHELVHIQEKNHSRRFWDALESILPDYRQHRLWLKKNGHLLIF